MGYSITKYIYNKKDKLDVWFKHLGISSTGIIFISFIFLLFNESILEEPIIQTIVGISICTAITSMFYFSERMEIIEAEEHFLNANIDDQKFYVPQAPRFSHGEHQSLESHIVPFLKIKLYQEMFNASYKEIESICANTVKEIIVKDEYIKDVNVNTSIKDIKNMNNYKIVNVNINIKFNKYFFSDKNINKEFIWLAYN